MNVSVLEWIITVGVMAAVLAFDVVVIARRPHRPSTTEAVAALAGYVMLAVLFGVWVWFGHDHRSGLQFFAGWLTEYSLSIDNLFVFIVIMASFNVPKRYEQQVLFVGIVLALVFRGVLIGLGAVAINKMSWIFYPFGAFLVYAAVRMGRGGDHDSEETNAVVRWAQTRRNTTDSWHGLRLYVRQNAKWVMTPMLLVVSALGAADLMFALDSIPAIYGLTREPYLVVSANVLALMGLRQLYFLLGGALKRLVYLSQGLAVVLAFIGVKLFLHALQVNELAFINDGDPVDVPRVSTLASLAFIVVILAATTAASLYKTRVFDAD